MPPYIGTAGLSAKEKIHPSGQDELLGELLFTRRVGHA